ncbi:MAG: hypothetical protein JKP98_17525 [Rhodobacteraceae bacterium]|nr:hypothetical protein [Paracoccaceae bacterium]
MDHVPVCSGLGRLRAVRDLAGAAGGAARRGLRQVRIGARWPGLLSAARSGCAAQRQQTQPDPAAPEGQRDVQRLGTAGKARHRPKRLLDRARKPLGQGAGGAGLVDHLAPVDRLDLDQTFGPAGRVDGKPSRGAQLQLPPDAGKLVERDPGNRRPGLFDGAPVERGVERHLHLQAQRIDGGRPLALGVDQPQCLGVEMQRCRPGRHRIAVRVGRHSGDPGVGGREIDRAVGIGDLQLGCCQLGLPQRQHRTGVERQFADQRGRSDGHLAARVASIWSGGNAS